MPDKGFRWNPVTRYRRLPGFAVTARMADLIVVLENASISEVGTHDELMESGGTYARLFELQAMAYRA